MNLETSFKLCKFSPLRTPDIRKPKKKVKSKKESSDICKGYESTASSVTGDIHTIVKSVSSHVDHLFDSDESQSLLLTQNFPDDTLKQQTNSDKKSKNKKQPAVSQLDDKTMSSDSDSSMMDTSSESEAEQEKDKVKDAKERQSSNVEKRSSHNISSSSASSDSDSDSDSNSEAEGTNKKVTESNFRNNNGKDSASPVSSKSRKRHTQSESDEESDIEQVSKVKSKKRLTATHTPADGFETPAKKSKTSDPVIDKVASPAKKSRTSDSVIDKVASPAKKSKTSDSVIDKVVSPAKKSDPVTIMATPGSTRIVNSPRRHVSFNIKTEPESPSEESEEETDDRDNPNVSFPSAESSWTPQRYQIPGNFEVKSSARILSQEALKGKQLYIIRTPSQFDVSLLHKRKLSLDGKPCIVADMKTEKQYEVTTLDSGAESTNLHAVASGEGSDSLRVGPSFHGEIMIMDWIPSLPPVTLQRTKRGPHTIPDGLEPTFKPFGSESPQRCNNEAETVSSGKKKGSKKKKEKRKNKEIEESQDIVDELPHSKKAKKHKRAKS